METEIIAPLEKSKITKDKNKSTDAAPGCCGGAPTKNEDACCKLDEEKKEEGEAGCGCNTPTADSSKTACC